MTNKDIQKEVLPIDRELRREIINNYKRRFNKAKTSKELSSIKKEFYSLNYQERVLDNMWEEIAHDKRIELLQALDLSSLRLINHD